MYQEFADRKSFKLAWLCGVSQESATSRRMTTRFVAPMACPPRSPPPTPSKPPLASSKDDARELYIHMCIVMVEYSTKVPSLWCVFGIACWLVGFAKAVLSAHREGMGLWGCFCTRGWCCDGILGRLGGFEPCPWSKVSVGSCVSGVACALVCQHMLLVFLGACVWCFWCGGFLNALKKGWVTGVSFIDLQLVGRSLFGESNCRQISRCRARHIGAVIFQFCAASSEQCAGVCSGEVGLVCFHCYPVDWMYIWFKIKFGFLRNRN